MDFMHKRREQMKVSSMADLKRSGKVTGASNPALFVHGPEEFDCNVEKWSRQELGGIIGDSGVGKSEVVLQFFKSILKNNPTSNAVYVSLEMTDEKIAKRWYKITEDCPELAERLFVLSRYDENGKAREVNVHWIKKELVRYREIVGDMITFAIDHVHCLGENDASTLNSLFIILKEMCVELNAYGIAMAQVNKSSGQKGEVPLDADSVLGCSQMKYICSDIIQIHRPIARLEEEAKMSVLSWGYVKVREPHKDDKVKKGQNKLLLYEPETRSFRKMNSAELTMFKEYYNCLLEMKSAEEKHKAFTYDITKEVLTKDGKKVTITEKFSGRAGDDL
jgi:hypothetical protein